METQAISAMVSSKATATHCWSEASPLATIAGPDDSEAPAGAALDASRFRFARAALAYHPYAGIKPQQRVTTCSFAADRRPDSRIQCPKAPQRSTGWSFPRAPE